MKILVTGASGFVGRHVVAEILNKTDWSVVALDRYPSQHTAELEDRDTRVCAVSYDLHEPLRSNAFNDVDVVINLASSSDVPAFLEDPAWHTLNNVTSTLNLLEWARHRSLRAFIQVSTNEVYGPVDDLTLDSQEWDSLVPQTPYSASKAAQEMLAIGWHQTYGVPAIIVNTMHVYGEGQPTQRFIPMAINKILDDEPIPLFNHPRGSQVRNWTYVGNLARALTWLIDNDDVVRKLDRWNVAGPEKSCLDIVRLLGSTLNRKFTVKWVSGPRRPGHDYRYSLNLSKLSIAGFVRPYSINVGLERTINWVKQTREESSEAQ